jgi:hypothetical protein
MILYLKDPKNSTKNSYFINTFSKVAGYKIHTQKSVAFLYTNNEQTEKEARKTIHLKNKIPRNKFNKEVKDLYTGNYKMLKKSKTPEDKKITRVHGSAESIL